MKRFKRVQLTLEDGSKTEATYRDRYFFDPDTKTVGLDFIVTREGKEGDPLEGEYLKTIPGVIDVKDLPDGFVGWVP